MIGIKRLPPARWRDFRGLRLEALRADPGAFGSSYEEEMGMPGAEWRRRIKNTLFAVCNGKPIGMIACVFGNTIKGRHIMDIYSFYVSGPYRGRGVGRRLLKGALSIARKKGGIVKVKLDVNPAQRAAVRLYKEQGFKAIGTERKELKVNGRFFNMLLLEKFL